MLRSKLGSSERAPGIILTLHRKTLRLREASKRTEIDTGQPQNHFDIFLECWNLGTLAAQGPLGLWIELRAAYIPL